MADVCAMAMLRQQPYEGRNEFDLHNRCAARAEGRASSTGRTSDALE
jgi:hypothetical protein